MQEATVDRLSKIISDPRSSEGSPGDKRPSQPRRPAIQISIGLAEGWFSLFLLAAVVYSTIWCVQAANWVPNLTVLSLTTALGLITGVIAAKQKRIPQVYMHLIALTFGVLLAFWQTAGADYASNTGALFNEIHRWIGIALAGGTSTDDSIFLFFITTLGFLLAYASAWLVYRTRSPWLMILANSIVLLINLSNIEDGYVVFLIVFLIAALLLLLRFNLYESSKRWRLLGLRCADDLGWDFMQAGVLISIGILVVSWILPWGYTNDDVSQIWSAGNNPWVQIENTWNRLISVSGGITPANHGNFTDTLALGGNPNLNNDIVFTVKSDDPTQYLSSVSYSTYDGRNWTNGPTYSTSNKSNANVGASTAYSSPIKQVVNVVNPPGEQLSYIFGASQIAVVNQDTQVLTNKSDASIIAFLKQNGRLGVGDHYTVLSYISSADVNALRSVPFPVDAPKPTTDFTNHDTTLPLTYYDPTIVSTYTQLPKGLDTNILQKTMEITGSAKTMYDKAVALEAYFQNNYTYDPNINLPAGQEGVSWFLFRSGHRGFCNYFATAMTVMARELGMPARVVAGYTNGERDPKHDQSIIRGKDAHSWTQIYFAGYGWVNFEPSAGFHSFVRPLPGSTPTTVVGGGGSGTPLGNRKPGLNDRPDSGSGGSVNTITPAQSQARLREQVTFSLGGLVLLILFSLMLFSIWWRRLFRGYGITAQIYGRIYTLANWAGISIKHSQTPYEYMNTLAEAAPEQALTLERLGDIYVRDLWADPSSPEHPSHSGEIKELPGLWKALQPQLFLYVLRHPHFLRRLPQHIWNYFSHLRSRKRSKRTLNEEI